MFRSSSRTHAEPVALSGGATQASPWRPTIRKIKQGLFSSKDDPLSSGDHPCTGTTVTTTQPLNETPQEADASLSRTASFGSRPTKVSTLARTRTTRSRERSKGSSEVPNSKGFVFIKRSASVSRSKSRKHRPTESQGALLHDLTDSDCLGQLGTITPYIPKHAASDFSKSTKQQKTQELAPPQSSTTPYTPTHAASDFSKIRLAPKIADANPTPAKSRGPSLQQEENNDYQLFLAAARAAAARTYNTTGVISPNRACPPASSNMRAIIAKY
ncbi:hypothetical protein EG329_006491 [Mollisiaceae sp. DMI_Dod_QoI]|nr:hypothetical protein EG329_006491 [Helotiales sp. DMI_Dod_QoI]